MSLDLYGRRDGRRVPHGGQPLGIARSIGTATAEVGRRISTDDGAASRSEDYPADQVHTDREPNDLRRV